MYCPIDVSCLLAFCGGPVMVLVCVVAGPGCEATSSEPCKVSNGMCGRAPALCRAGAAAVISGRVLLCRSPFPYTLYSRVAVHLRHWRERNVVSFWYVLANVDAIASACYLKVKL
jgi:hypothetical protein